MHSRNLLSTAFLLLAMPWLVPGCVGDSARILGEDEPDLVDVHGAGAATYEILVTESVAKLLDPHRSRFATDPTVPTVAFVDLENRSAEELGEWREQLLDRIRSAVSRHGSFRLVSDRLVTAVMREMGNPPVDQLLLPAGRRRFAEILERQDEPVQFLLYGSLTRGGTQGDYQRQANYLLTLELIDVKTGLATSDETMVRKAFAN
jgi:hypothetical protein